MAITRIQATPTVAPGVTASTISVTFATPPSLGNESYRLDATNADGANVTVLGWRDANLVLVVIGTSFAPASVEALARLVDARALSAAPS